MALWLDSDLMGGHTLTTDNKPSTHIPICVVVSKCFLHDVFQGGPDELADALAPHMEFAEALRYLDQEPVCIDRLLKRSWQAMYGLATNLPFTKSPMSTALAIVAEKKNFNLDPDAACEYQGRTTARMRRAVTLLKHCDMSSPAEEYDEQYEHVEQDPHDFGAAGYSNSTVFVCGVDAGSKSVTRKVVGSRKHAIETTFDVVTQSMTRRWVLGLTGALSPLRTC